MSCWRPSNVSRSVGRRQAKERFASMGYKPALAKTEALLAENAAAASQKGSALVLAFPVVELGTGLAEHDPLAGDAARADLA